MSFTLSKEGQEELSKIITHYPNTRAAVLPALWLVQEETGFLSDEAMEYVSKTLDLPFSDVYGTATFYTMFRRRKIGRYHIQVCTNICCWLRGSEDVLNYLEARLGIKAGQTTEDGLFTLSTVECLGACGSAPMIQVNNDYYENLTFEKLDGMINQWTKS